MLSVNLAKNLVVWPVDRLKPYERNARTHSDSQVEQIAASIAEFGFTNPILVDTQDGIIAGHGRLMAAKRLGLEEVPVVVLDHLTEEQRRAYIIADNKLALNAGWDESVLAEELRALEESGFDLSLTGFSDEELADLIPDTEALDPQGDEDEVPDALSDPKVVKGEIYILGNHRLMCGDSTAITDVDRLMNGNKADCLFTDPPYGYSYESNHQNKHGMLMNDDKIVDFMPSAYAAMADNSAAYVCGSHQTIHLWRPIFEQYFEYKNLIVWKKNNWSMGDLTGAFGGQHELILFGHKGRVELRGGRTPDVWDFDRDPPKEHPTQKPIPMLEHALSKVSDSRSMVLDLFGGSGSTLIACEKTDRHCFMMELDPHYCGVILDRWQKFTGKKAHREDGKLWDEIKAE